MHSVVASASAAGLVVVWLAILVAGLDPAVLCPDAPDDEGSSLSAGLLLWPPGGIECVYVSPAGDRERTTHFPWDLWGSTALFAAGAACAATAAALLVPAAAAVWFL